MLKFYAWAESRLAALREEEGAAMAEYAVILGLITAIVAATLLAIGGAINVVFEEVLGVFGG